MSVHDYFFKKVFIYIFMYLVTPHNFDLVDESFLDINIFTVSLLMQMWILNVFLIHLNEKKEIRK